MRFNNQQKEVPSDAPIAEQARPYYEYRKRISELDFWTSNGREIARYCLQNYPYMAKEFDISDERQLLVLKSWINENIKNYITCVDLGFESIAKNPILLGVYLTKKLINTLNGIEELSFINSYDNKLVLNYHYETKRGETISYFDKALGVPTTLVATANIRLKLINAQKLVEKIDVDIHKIDASIVVSFITAAFNSIVRDTVLSLIATKNLSFYDLPQHYSELNQAVLNALNAYFNACGMEATYFAFSDISVPNNTEQMLKNQFFALAEVERVKAHEQRIEKASLDLYERKAEIHSKYPDFPMTLTEAEKDFALNRYLTRTGREITHKTEIEEEKLAGRKEELRGTETVGEKSAPPTVVKISYKFRNIFIAVVAVLYVVALIMFAMGVKFGFAALAAATLGAGITLAACFKQIKYGTEIRQTVEVENKGNAVQQTGTAVGTDEEQKKTDIAG